MKNYLVRIETYLSGVRTIAKCDSKEEAEKILGAYHFKTSPIVRENEVAGWIEEKEDKQND